jgi:hypothetical protein
MSSNIPNNPLPFANVQEDNEWIFKRNIISWYVPQVGVIKMYINPQNLSFRDSKILQEERTKGGFSVSYFGENITGISISGHTGTSGIEGINILYEIYRAEQYLFDQNAVLINSVNNQTPTSTITSYIGQQLGGTSGADVANIINNVSGINDPMNMTQLNPRNMTTLADIAFGIEMYYSGWVYRGYFKDFTLTERADNFLTDYSMNFMATSRRGYRTNTHAFQRSPEGPSNYDSVHSYDPNYTINGNTFIGNINSR